MNAISPKSIAWPHDRTVYLTLDLERDYGTALSEEYYEALKSINQLIELLEQFDVPLTCFVQTKILHKRPEVVEKLRTSGVKITFHPHSHTHKPRSETSVSGEIKTSTNYFSSFFGYEPIGYRFPNGNIRRPDYRLLTEYNYKFDASVFPSWRPGHFNNMSSIMTPRYRPDDDIYELPFTVYSERLRIPTSLSYCQVFGSGFTSILTRRPPPVLVLNIHMHDLVTPTTIRDLPFRYRALYSRNPDGIEILKYLIRKLKNKDYTFRTLNSLYNMISEGKQ